MASTPGGPRTRTTTYAVALALVGVLTACSTAAGSPEASAPESTSAGSAITALGTVSPTTAASPSATVLTPSTTPTPPDTQPAAQPFDTAYVLDGIRALVRIGPRDAASAAYDRAAALVAARMRAAGYRVTLQPFRVPAGVSWGVAVAAGSVVNVVADPPGFDPRRPHVVIGAHLDTVPQSPGAEDNASGVMVLAEVARMVRQQPVAVPVRFVVFGAEEARGGGGTRYAFGSRHYVSTLATAERRSVRGMVALDRVGVRAAQVPVCSGGRGTSSLARALRQAAAVPTRACTNRASDHVAFEAVGIPAARLGSVPYAAYHSSRDLPSVVDARQLARTGAVVWSWLRSLR